MGKRVDPRRLRAAQTYTVPELARSIGVSTGTVRGWIRHGLPALTTQRPTLIVGSDAKDFLSQRKRSKKRPLRPNEVYCLTCKEPRKVFENMVELERVPAKPARIIGFLRDLRGVCFEGRRGGANWGAGQVLRSYRQHGRRSLTDTLDPCSNRHFERRHHAPQSE